MTSQLNINSTNRPALQQKELFQSNLQTINENQNVTIPSTNVSANFEVNDDRKNEEKFLFFNPEVEVSNKRKIDFTETSGPSKKLKSIDDSSKSIDSTNNSISEVQNLKVYDDNIPLNAELNHTFFRCRMCLNEILPGNVIQLNCSHNFCKSCIYKVVMFPNALPIRCPYWEDNSQCNYYLKMEEIKFILVKEDYELYCQALSEFRFSNIYNKSENKHNCLECLNRGTEQYHSENNCKIIGIDQNKSNIIYCKSSNCFYIYLKQNNEETFICPLCNQPNCLKCSNIHEGECLGKLDCEIIQNDLNNENVPITLPLNETNQSEMGQVDLEYDNLIEISKFNLIPNYQEFECIICFTSIKAKEGVVLYNCLHQFCRDCLAQTIEACDSPFVKCPFIDKFNCESFLLDREIKALLSPEKYERFLQKSLSTAECQAKDSFHCKTPDCKGWCFIDSDITEFQCPICEEVNCIKCSAVHKGKTCIEYGVEHSFDSEDEKTKKLLLNKIKKGKAMRCPRCMAVIEKISGCDGMNCSMCGLQICWATKMARWGPAGPGDITGGCKCSLGNRCHPKCHGCH